jgi:hypothetical protein
MSLQYFAQINESNIVTAVHIVSREFLEANPERYEGIWVETFQNVVGKTYAGVGYIYNPPLKDFTAPVVEP